MKYLKSEIYYEATQIDNSCTNKWNKLYDEFLKEFDSIKNRLPNKFLTEFHKKHFHDNIVKSILIEKRELKHRNKYDLVLHLEDYYEKNIEHILKFIDINNYKSCLEFCSFSGRFDWIYCEILPIDEKRMSFEVVLFEDSTLYLEFSKLQYKKIITQV